ncbi:hypothetical protein Tco_0273655 [Tanacetum coccineum]
MSLDYSSSLKFDLFSDLEDQSEEEVTEAMTEPNVEEYMTITRKDYDTEDAVEHIEIFLKIVDLLNVPNMNHDQLRIIVFPFSLTRAASKWWKDESIGSITTWVDLTEIFFGKFYPPSRTGRKIENNGANIIVEWDPTNIKFENWLVSKFRNYKMMDRYTKNALWDYWRRGDDEELTTDNELFNPRDDNLIEENEIAQIFRIKAAIFHFKTPLSEAFKEFNYLSQINVDVLIKDIPGFKTFEEYKDGWMYE